MIRPAEIRDVPLFGKIINDCAEYGLMLHRSFSYLYEHLRDFRVSVADGQVVGVCGLSIAWANLAEVYALAVAPEHRGRGLGRQLVLNAIDEGEELGIKKLMTLTYEKNFFERCGFSVVDRQTLPLKVWSECARCPKNQACDEIAMVRLLDVPELNLPQPEIPPMGAYEVPVLLGIRGAAPSVPPKASDAPALPGGGVVPAAMTDSNHPWLAGLLDSSPIGVLAQTLREHRFVQARGSQGSSGNLLAGLLALALNRQVLLVVAHLDDADDALDDLELFSAAGLPLSAWRFGALEVLPGESSVSLELLAERLTMVSRLASGAGTRPSVLVAPIQALMQSVPRPDALGDLSMTFAVGQDLPPGKFLEWLAAAGYERADAVEQPGQFAARGGIIDIFPPAASLDGASPLASDDDSATSGGAGASGGGPIRIDYFGDQIETICRIDPDTLGSGARLSRVQIIGASVQQLQSDERTTGLLSLLGDETLVILHEPMELAEQARGYYERLTNPRGIYAPNSLFKAVQERRRLEIHQYSATSGYAPIVEMPLGPLAAFDHDAAKAVTDLRELADEDPLRKVVVLCPKPAERDRLLEMLSDRAADLPPNLSIEVGYVHRGFLWTASSSASASSSSLKPQASSLLLVPHQELFHRYDTRRRIRRISTEGAGAKSADAFLEIAPGDYVVHSDHGIARFTGLRPMKGGTASDEEYLTLEFAGKALLHVPASQIDLIQKYVGGFHGKPPLSTLGGKRWAKQKEQVAEAVKELAAELLRVQAARSSMPGVRFPADTPWQKEFEAEFPYQETDDQLAAIAAVKRDMSDDQPMDRLICGDVGFGKTEVAIRAAFKAAEFGKQVAVLVPTTVLAEQHERTFRGRMADYPFRVESISRFKTASQAREILDRVRTGQVDVIIGTHRLLSEDVKFADLGVVVIDEEQRFGVEHKNRLLQFRLTADVLTLSATPIPRTLHMAMLGLRDISSLATAPMDRRAIVTEVVPYNEQRIRAAIIRELNRDGQVYFVHNRIYNIQSVADDIHRLVPEARIVIGHGQMHGHELENVMLKFVRKQADVLVSTTIIESGLDIPTANTIFINQADHFGLSELHQLRGRVGRYKHRAYCYLMLPADRPITDKAAQRLKALEQYAMLGSGFKIAMRDLEIRGAGNLLGAEQSGHIAAVGYEMYCQLLEQETRRLKNEERLQPLRTHLELGVTGQLPRTYIPSEKFRMEAYRRICRAATLEELAAVVKDMADAYGQPPAPAQTLVDLAQLRIAAGTLEVDAVKRDGPDLIFRTKNPRKLDPYLKDAPGRASVIDEQTVYYRPPAKYLEQPGTMLAVLRKLLVRPA